jgi:hypothetical protein
MTTRSPYLPPLTVSTGGRSYADLPPLPSSPLPTGGYSNPLSPTSSGPQSLPLAGVSDGERSPGADPGAKRHNPLIDLIETETEYVDKLASVIKVSCSSLSRLITASLALLNTSKLD